MDGESAFGAWLKRRRRQLDLTQQALADCAACSVVSIRKFEAGERKPSRELARLLAACLAIEAGEEEAFVAFARGLQATFEDTPITASSAPFPPATALKVVLPAPPTPFVGRQDEVAQIVNMLSDAACRLLTLVGPGGMGKTRLALAAAQALTVQKPQLFGDGAAFVSLAAVSEPADLAPAIAQALEVPPAAAEKPEEQLARVLHNRRLLLVLDNFEQLIGGADMLSALLSACAQVKCLVTSRERLNLMEEWLLPVGGFAHEDAGLALFVQSARRVQAGFSLEGQEEVVLDICRYVGGMPLAIELAAGWTAALSCEQILAQMQKTFDFLSTSLRNVPQRHRSLRRLFDQSWELLSPAEQTLLMGLSVFRGGFALAEAEAVAVEGADVLLMLVNKSLVLVRNGRYDLHELTGQYAVEKLRESGQETAVRERHFRAFLALAEAFEVERSGPGAIGWFRQIETEQDNLRAALDWATENKVGESALRLADCLWWFWFRRGHWQEAERRFSRALKETEVRETPQRCRALLYLSTIIALQGRYGEAAPYLMEALTMARRLQDPETLAMALIVLSQAAPDSEQAMAGYLEAEALLRQIEPQQPRILAFLYNLLGEHLQENGRYEEAAAYYEQSRARYRQLGNVDLIAHPLGNLGRLALRRGRLDEARKLIGEALALSRATSNQQSMADWLVPLAKVSLYEGDVESAERHLQEALALYGDMNNRRGRAEATTGLALVALERGGSGAAQYVAASLALYDEMYHQTRQSAAALSSAAETVTPDVVDCLFVAALVAARARQTERAAVLFSRAQELQRHISHEPDAYLQQKLEAAQRALPLTGQVAATARGRRSLEEILQFAQSDSEQQSSAGVI